MDTMNIICNFCKKEFTTKGNLISHQRTAKYCLEIQGKNIENYKCTYCNKNFTSLYNLNEHYNSCKLKKKEEEKLIEKKRNTEYNNKIRNIEEKYKKEIDNYKLVISQKDREIENYKLVSSQKDKEIENYKLCKKEIEMKDEIIEKFEKKIESYEKRLFEMASRPTNNSSSTKTVVINNNSPLTNEVLRQCANTFTLENAKNIKGITKHFTESLEDHITCTDYARNIFKYKNEKDEEIVDSDLENLLPQYLGVLKDKNNFLYKEMINYFKENNVSINEQTDYNIFYNALNAIIERNNQQNKYSEKMKKYIVRQCKKQFLDKNKNKEKEITKELTDEEIMMNVIETGGSVYDFIERIIEDFDIDNETDEQFEYRRNMEDLFRKKKKEYKLL
jgi:hypothetical protein